MASADVTAELRCSICMEIYRDPVTLPCGHNFCRGCITQTWDLRDDLTENKCPECQRIYRRRPELRQNTTLHQIAEVFHATETDQEQTGVFCNYCEFPVPATKSCLQCETSLCDHHLRRHDKSGGHTLLPPTTDLGKRKCSVHKEILEYYCVKDAACVCASCYVIGEHVGHKILSLDEASEEKKKKLRNDQRKLMVEAEKAEKIVQSLEDLRRNVQEKADGETERVTTLFRDLRKQLQNPKKIIQSVEEYRRKAQEKADGETERVTALFRDLRRRQKDLEKKVLSDITRQAKSYEGVVRQMEIKKEELSRKIRHIEELCSMTDPLTVLQESDTGDLCDTEDRERHDKQFHDGGYLDVAGISHTLHTGLADVMSGVSGGIYIYIQHADIFLDVNTAGNNLHISADRKTASWSDRNQNHPETPERFQDHCQVLSSQRFSSGRHYWEVDVGGSAMWAVGLSYPSVARRGGQSWFGMNNKSWGLYRNGNQYAVVYDNKEIPLANKIPSDRVRIYLDYEAGQISFYAPCDPIRHLHTFISIFTEPLHAGLLVFIGCIKLSKGIQNS
ncbi:E3 ubiquitin-protein ligase TRIM39-like [Hyperolius riggenbachi]|uniref:E3 ubiquitin-protein ligase TRIM39-like n=1 Tax=Hyperolius riggenbachi TaxID=752182 RepID=UPI0035A3569B